jgi:hypothetical protein
MIADYRATSFAGAAEANVALQKTAPPALRGLYEKYAKRIVALQQTPPAADWDGVFTLLEK